MNIRVKRKLFRFIDYYYLKYVNNLKRGNGNGGCCCYEFLKRNLWYYEKRKVGIINENLEFSKVRLYNREGLGFGVYIVEKN